MALVLFLISTEAAQNDIKKRNKVRRVVRRRGRQRTNRQIGFGNRVPLAPAVRFAPAPLAPAPLPVKAPSPQPIQVVEVTPNNFGSFRTGNQLFHVRQPVVHSFAPAPAVPAPAPIRVAPFGHHFVPSTIVQARANALPLVPAPVAKAAPVATPAPVTEPEPEPLPVAAPAPIALPVALPAPVAAPIPIAR